ncbi:MAG: hypothetical protein ACRD27_12705, partial [Terracidiphilus sp.]
MYSADGDSGSGDPRTVVVGLLSFNLFGLASLKTVDDATNLATGPVGTIVTPTSRNASSCLDT